MSILMTNRSYPEVNLVGPKPGELIVIGAHLAVLKLCDRIVRPKSTGILGVPGIEQIDRVNDSFTSGIKLLKIDTKLGDCEIERFLNQ